MATRPFLYVKKNNWYTPNPDILTREIEEYLALVPETIHDSSLPIPGARMIIAPHAAYVCSGENAAWAYSCLDLSKTKRVFLLGTNHTMRGLYCCALTTFDKYATPFGDFTVDSDILERLRETEKVTSLPCENDKVEHSLENQLPFLYKRCEQTFESPESFPKVVPIVVGATSPDYEKDMGRLLLSYIKDPENAFIISGDFCHWGPYYDYMAYSYQEDVTKLTTLSKGNPKPLGPPIHEIIRLIDEAALNAIKSGNHDAFVSNLELTGNTVCGQHAIGVAMAALELYTEEINDENKSRFKDVKYDRNEKIEFPTQNSVSYVSAYAVL